MYIDPNTGGVLFQILAVIFGVFSGIILLSSSKIRMAFAKMRRRLQDRKAKSKEAFSGDETPPPAA